ncbi:AAA family ATPase [Mucilaginibacter sp. AW1-7]|jgi:predicted kinase|uniref:AAA family ATPase n=1 Tax=unclassified Mucilaginibacter TaxID=2617802 RepID=UPI002365D6CF|nr:AAA family ATPase [Mucilaginibacter sp. KACC 22773]WDF79903.1 AAA family ATPase [Mucilaginibacter sp. KACC 22773]
MIVAVLGLPGSGKTYFAAALAARLNARLISSDTVRRQMNQNGRYDDLAKKAVYLEMISLMESGIADEQSVVLDATFYKANLRILFMEKAEELSLPIYFIEVRAAEATIKKRVAQRRPDSEAGFAAYQNVKQEFEALTGPHLVLFSDRRSLHQMLETATAYLYDHEDK